MLMEVGKPIRYEKTGKQTMSSLKKQLKLMSSLKRQEYLCLGY